MSRIFHGRLAIPLWATVVFAVALAARPPALVLLIPALFVIAAIAIAVLSPSDQRDEPPDR